MAYDTVRQIAENDTSEGLEVSDFVRENGWVDNENINRYTVRFNYNLKLKKSYQEVVLNHAILIKNEFPKKDKNSKKEFFDINSMQNDLALMSYAMTVNQWIKNQGDDFRPRRNNFLKKCKPCIDYWNGTENPKERDSNVNSFILSWKYFEELGFKDDAVLGSTIPRQAFSHFMKTEKGWLPVQ